MATEVVFIFENCFIGSNYNFIDIYYCREIVSSAGAHKMQKEVI